MSMTMTVEHHPEAMAPRPVPEGVAALGPLSRFHLLDLSRVRAGPSCVRQFADWGANVIKVEATGGGDHLGGPRHGPDFQNLHRNKRTMSLDLKTPKGLEVLHELVKRADIVVENFRPDVKDRLGIGYAALAAINPAIVYASISGYGQTGPYAKRAGFDQVAQGMGGLMSITGLPGQGPVRAGIPVADLAAGLFATIGILTALLERQVSGKGQWVQTSLLQAQIMLLDFQAARWLISREVPQQAGNDHPTGIPTGVFPASDGVFNLAVLGEDIYHRLCNVLEAPELKTDPRFRDADARSQNRAAMNAAICAITSTKSVDFWIGALDKAGVACGPIYAIDEMFNDPQVRHLGIVQSVDHPKLGKIDIVGQPFTLSRTPSQMRTAAPDPGQHTSEILAELGYDVPAIIALAEEGII